MSRARELAAGGRAVEVEPERLVGFLDRFAAGHGGVLTAIRDEQLTNIRQIYPPEREALGVVAIGIELVDPPR